MLDTKAENEAFGIFLRITNRKVRILPEGTLVARRVGGLEATLAQLGGHLVVARRVGGLEGHAEMLKGTPHVARRVGGLEVLRVREQVRLSVARRAGGMVPVFSFSLPMRKARFSRLFFGSGPAEGAPVQEEGARPAHSGHLRLSSFALASTSIPGCGEPYPRAAARHSASSIGEACL